MRKLRNDTNSVRKQRHRQRQNKIRRYTRTDLLLTTQFKAQQMKEEKKRSKEKWPIDAESRLVSV